MFARLSAHNLELYGFLQVPIFLYLRFNQSNL